MSAARYFRFAGELEVEKYLAGDCEYVDLLVRSDPETGEPIADYIVEIGDGDGALAASSGGHHGTGI